jgi:hypothetical protein
MPISRRRPSKHQPKIKEETRKAKALELLKRAREAGRKHWRDYGD